MSNHYRLRCNSHDGVVPESDEVGNNSAKPASLVMKNRDSFVQAVKLLEPLDITKGDVIRAHWDSYAMHAMFFVAEHPTCKDITLHDDGGHEIPFEDEPDPHSLPGAKYCDKCGGRLGTYGHMNSKREWCKHENACVDAPREC